MVIRKPSRKPTPMMRKRFWLRVSMEPTRSPMGVMLISAPKVKNMMPTMIMAAPSRKQSRMLGETGAMLKQSTSTMAAMGRTQGDKAVILDLHNADYYYHVFTYPDFQYQSSFGKRGEGPGESIYAANIRFAGQDTVWVLDDGKGRMYQYSGIAGGKTPKQEKDILLDKRLFRSLDFDLKDASTVVIPDYSGENRFSWASLSSGELLRKSEQIPVSDPELLRESAPAVAQGWNSFVSFSPDKKILVSVTQFGDRLDIYSMASQKHIGELGGDGEPQFKVSPEGYGLPAGRICYYDVQVTDQYIYTIYDGRKFKDIMKLADAYQQGGKILRISTHEGDVVKTYVLDRPIAGIYVDEAAGMLFGLDVNADEQIVKFPLELE